jgi:hypothetical protein
MAGLETLRIYAVDTRRVMLKIRCPQDRLTDVAEVLRLKMKTLDGENRLSTRIFFLHYDTHKITCMCFLQAALPHSAKTRQMFLRLDVIR